MTGIMKKAEPFMFGLLVFIHALPILVLHFFPTVDGPAHLYNSNLINNYFASSSSAVHDYFSFNREPEPNWLGHIILCLLNFMLPSFLAEKTAMLLYIVLLSFSFRILIKRFNKNNILASYFIFPFIYTFLFYLGFYNFCISIALLLFVIYYWQDKKNNQNARKITVFAVLLLLLYFAHLFAFLLFITIAFLFFLAELIKDKKSRNILTAKNIFYAGLPYLPGILLTLNFLLKKGDSGKISFLPFSTLFSWLLESAPLITLNHDNEYFYTTVLSCIWAILFLISVFARITKKAGLERNDIWLLLAMLVLGAYFVSPNDAASGGYISMRIALIFYILLILWIAQQHLGKLIYFVAGVCCVVLSLVLLNKHYIDSKALSEDVVEMYTAAEYIEEGKNLLPLNYSGNWLHSNFSNYLGSEKDIIVLDNYEAATPHFPLQWKDNRSPYKVAGDFANSNTPCLTLGRYENISGIKVDYITRWYYNVNATDSCTQQVNNLLSNKFEKIFTSPQQKMEVFKRIKM